MPFAQIPRLRAVLLACATLLAAPCAVDAQTVEPGARVRILAPSAADTLITGTLVAIDSGSLLLAASFDTAGVHVPLSTIRRLEVAADPRHSGTTGGLVGLARGAAAGYALYSPCPRHSGCATMRNGTLVAGAFVGMLVGKMIGRNIGGDAWRTVPVPGQDGP
jgi:hypothetical protein